jgi:hypothetical protein
VGRAGVVADENGVGTVEDRLGLRGHGLQGHWDFAGAVCVNGSCRVVGNKPSAGKPSIANRMLNCDGFFRPISG